MLCSDFPCFFWLIKNLFHKPPHPSQVGKLLEGEIDELPDLTKADGVKSGSEKFLHQILVDFYHQLQVVV